jgi:WD40 repeat protein
MEKPLRTLSSKNDIYQDHDLDDQALALILRPEKRIQHTTTNAPSAVGRTGLASRIKINLTTTVQGSIFDQVHPNCLTFSDSGRLFVGDSRGQINVWDVALRHGNLIAENHFRIVHKELDGDQINAITVHPEHLNQLIVHSRDNCIRLLEYESSRGPKVKQRFFGSRCKDMPCLSTSSPDGQFIVSGSEDGKPRIWDTSLE